MMTLSEFERMEDERARQADMVGDRALELTELASKGDAYAFGLLAEHIGEHVTTFEELVRAAIALAMRPRDPYALRDVCAAIDQAAADVAEAELDNWGRAEDPFGLD